MTDPQPNPRRSLSEISHLFLSDVRDSVSGGVRPQRLPPGAPRPAPAARKLDDPSEWENDHAAAEDSAAESAEPMPTVKQVVALVAAHLNGSAVGRAKQYAAHLASQGARVGLIELSGAEMRLGCFERSGTAAGNGTNGGAAAECLESCDVRHAGESLAELAWDVNVWLVLLSDPRAAEARQLLASVPHWVLLSTCDHDGVVSCYRSIKGLAGKSREERPRLSLALLDAADADEASRVHRKIAGVCQQFLDWPLEPEPAVAPIEALERQVVEHSVLVCRPGSGAASGSLWRTITDFLKTVSTEPVEAAEADLPDPVELEKPAKPVVQNPPQATRVAEQPIRMTPPEQPAPMPVAVSMEPAKPQVSPPIAPATPPIAQVAEESEVTELPPGETGEAAVLSAVLKQQSLGLIASPVHPPAAPQAVLAVNRDRRLVLLAVARPGLAELRALGQAYQWVIENRPLLSMALPQFAVDAHAMPALRLMVDRRDLSAEQLQPLMQSGNVIVQTYRKLRWGEKTGLLLEAA